VANDYYKENFKYSQEALNYAFMIGSLLQKQFQSLILALDQEQYQVLPISLSTIVQLKLAVEASSTVTLPDKNKLYDKFRNRLMFPIKTYQETL
jgi:hypothetical protein